MRIETTRTFPVPLKRGWDYLQDMSEIPNWRTGVIEILDLETAKWTEPGDSFRFAYRLLGRRVEGITSLEAFREYELDQFTSRIPGLPMVREEWHYAPAGDGAFTLRIVQETEPATSFFGKAIDATLLPRVLDGDLRRSLDNLEDILVLQLAE